MREEKGSSTVHGYNTAKEFELMALVHKGIKKLHN